MKHQYLKDIRRDSCYPTFRGFMTLFEVVGYIVAFLVGIVGMVALGAPLPEGKMLAIGIVIGALLLGLMIKAIKEGCLMLADIADCTIDGSAGASATDQKVQIKGDEMTLAEIQQRFIG